MEILDAVHLEYSNEKPFDTTFADHLLSVTALTLPDWLSIVERCLYTEKLEEQEELERMQERDEREKQFRAARKLQKEQLFLQLQSDRILSENRKRRSERTVVSRVSTSSSSASRGTESSIRRSLSCHGNRMGDTAEIGERGGRGGGERNYSVCDARAHAFAKGGLGGGVEGPRSSRQGSDSAPGGGAGGVGGAGVGSGVQSLSSGGNRTATRLAQSGSTGSRVGSGSVSRVGSRVGGSVVGGGGGVVGRSTLGVRGDRGGGGGFLFSTGTVHPSAGQGMMKTRVGHYEHRQTDKQQRQQHGHGRLTRGQTHQQQQQRAWDLEDQSDRPTLRSKANRTFKLRQTASLQQRDSAGGSGGGREHSPQRVSHVHDHQAWIR